MDSVSVARALMLGYRATAMYSPRGESYDYALGQQASPEQGLEASDDLDTYVRLIGQMTMAEPRLMHECPLLNADVTLRCNLPPYKSRHPLVIKSGSKLAFYANNVLNPVYRYLEEGLMFYHGEGFYCVHGGIRNEGKRSIDRVTDAQRLTELPADIDLNELHQIGFAKSVVTGRCDANKEAELGFADSYMHDTQKFTIVGHTPQNLGLPTVIRHTEESKFLVILDTQMSNREKNASCIGWDHERFLIKGYFDFKGTRHDYEASSDDGHIGTLDTTGSKHRRIVARVVGGEQNGKYVGVWYNGLKDDPPFASELSFVSLSEPTPSGDGVRGTEGQVGQFTHVACGDIEGSMPFLTNFLQLACNMLDIAYTPIAVGKQMTADALVTMTTSIQEKKVTIVCMGDVIGFAGPVGGPNEKRDLAFIPTTGDEAECLKWANSIGIIKIIGNRDVNKLRFLDELPFLQKHSDRLKIVDVKLPELQKVLLLGNCYPYIEKDGHKISKHGGGDLLLKLLPHMNLMQSATSPIWTPK